MKVCNISISNFKSFYKFNLTLGQNNILIGENETGKTNFLEAINFVLSNPLDKYDRNVAMQDFNQGCIDDIKNALKVYKENPSKESYDCILKNLPVIKVELTFDGADTVYEKNLLSSWLNVENSSEFKIYKQFKPKDVNKVADFLIDDINNQILVVRLPLSMYKKELKSSNNDKNVNYLKMQNFSMNMIRAERDNFESSEKGYQSRTFSKIIREVIQPEDVRDLEKHYYDFFNKARQTKSLKNLFTTINKGDQTNLKEFIKDLNIQPKVKYNLNVIENMGVSYGQGSLSTKGLGVRNLIYIIMVLGYFNTLKKTFNILTIEEPEAHLSMSNLVLLKSYFNEIKGKKSLFKLTQTIITTHSSKFIDKHNIDDVIVFGGEIPYRMNVLDKSLKNYISRKPSFDLLGFLFSQKTILVEGPSEELFLTGYLDRLDKVVYNVNIVPINQRGFKTFVSLWNKVNSDNNGKFLGVIRDFDKYVKAKENIEELVKRLNQKSNSEIYCVTTTEETFEKDLITEINNDAKIYEVFDFDKSKSIYENIVSLGKPQFMLDYYQKVDEGEIELVMPTYMHKLLKDMGIVKNEQDKK